MSYEWILEVLLIKMNANEMLLQGLYHLAQSYFKATKSSSGLCLCVCTLTFLMRYTTVHTLVFKMYVTSF
jgi:hypothetical protein